MSMNDTQLAMMCQQMMDTTSSYKWENGYNRDCAVVYRNISPSAIKTPHQFLQELDRSDCQVALSQSMEDSAHGNTQ